MAGKDRDPGCFYLVLLILIVSQTFTFYCLTNINVRYNDLQEDCSTEIRERETQIRVAADHAVELESRVDTCSKNSRQAATVGATWLSVAADVTGIEEVLQPLKALMAAVIVETPLRSFPSADLHLFAEGDSAQFREIQQEASASSWVESGRLTLSAVPAKSEHSGAHPSKLEGVTAPTHIETAKTLRMSKLLEAMQGRCEYMLLMDFAEEPVLCQHALTLMRYAVARADSYWGAWSGLYFAGGLSGTVVPCKDLGAISAFLAQQRQAATLPTLLHMFLSGDQTKNPALAPFMTGMQQPATPLFFRQTLIHRATPPVAACGSPVVLDDESVNPHGFDVEHCGFTDLSPCGGKLRDDWLRLQTGDALPPALSLRSSGSAAPAGGGGGVKLEFQGTPYALAELGESCSTACSKAGGCCDNAAMDKLNNCEALQHAFKCSSCGDNEGPDQPAQEDSGACLVKGSHKDFTCDASHAKTRRLCSCH